MIVSLSASLKYIFNFLLLTSALDTCLLEFSLLLLHNILGRGPSLAGLVDISTTFLVVIMLLQV